MNLLPKAQYYAFQTTAAMKQYLAEISINPQKISFLRRRGRHGGIRGRRFIQNEIFCEIWFVDTLRQRIYSAAFTFLKGNRYTGIENNVMTDSCMPILKLC